MSVSDRISEFIEDNVRTVLGRDLTGDLYAELDGKWVEMFEVDGGFAEISDVRLPYQSSRVKIDSGRVYRTLSHVAPFAVVDGSPEPSGWPSGDLIYVEEAYQALKGPRRGFSEKRLSWVYLYSEDWENGKSYYVPAYRSAGGLNERSLDEDCDLILRWHPVDVKSLEEYGASRV